MEQILLIIQVIVCVLLVLLVLVQQGKGATMGAAFGSGASSTVFGSKGSGSFLMKITALAAAVFFANSLALGYMATQASRQAKQNGAIQMPAQSAFQQPSLKKQIPVNDKNPSTSSAKDGKPAK